jgi:hypothetical protein
MSVKSSIFCPSNRSNHFVAPSHRVLTGSLWRRFLDGSIAKVCFVDLNHAVESGVDLTLELTIEGFVAG